MLSIFSLQIQTWKGICFSSKPICAMNTLDTSILCFNEEKWNSITGHWIRMNILDSFFKPENEFVFVWDLAKTFPVSVYYMFNFLFRSKNEKFIQMPNYLQGQDGEPISEEISRSINIVQPVSKITFKVETWSQHMKKLILIISKQLASVKIKSINPIIKVACHQWEQTDWQVQQFQRRNFHESKSNNQFSTHSSN